MIILTTYLQNTPVTWSGGRCVIAHRSAHLYIGPDRNNNPARPYNDDPTTNFDHICGTFKCAMPVCAIGR